MNRWLEWFRSSPPSQRGDTARDPDSMISPTAKTKRDSLLASGGPLLPVVGHLTVIEGPAYLLGRRFAVRNTSISIGRGEECYVSLPERGVSRSHAELRHEGGRLMLVHLSRTNPTLVNGVPVRDRQRLYGGDQIQLASKVMLRLDAPAHRREAVMPTPGSLSRAMEARVSLDERIERDYVRSGSFLDVDVCDSYGLKASEPRPERVVVSFDRFHAFVERAIQSNRGQVLNSTGDEVMAFFGCADDALSGGKIILSGLRVFNRQENLLADPFRVRVGIHTGQSAVDLDRGLAYSPVCDGAGHLQKAASAGGLLLSEETYCALSDPKELVKASVPVKGGIECYALATVAMNDEDSVRH